MIQVFLTKNNCKEIFEDPKRVLSDVIKKPSRQENIPVLLVFSENKLHQSCNELKLMHLSIILLEDLAMHDVADFGTL